MHFQKFNIHRIDVGLRINTVAIIVTLCIMIMHSVVFVASGFQILEYQLVYFVVVEKIGSGNALKPSANFNGIKLY